MSTTASSSTTTTKNASSSSSTSSIVVTTIVWLHILSHTTLFLFDYTLFTNSLDVLQRNDGTRSDPTNLFPLEIAFAMLVAMNHGTIAVAYIVSILLPARTKPDINNNNNNNNRMLMIYMASILSAWFHGMFLVHMIWKWDVWNHTFHPDGSMPPAVLLGVHCLWFGLASVAIVLTTTDNNDTVATTLATNEQKVK